MTDITFSYNESLTMVLALYEARRSYEGRERPFMGKQCLELTDKFDATDYNDVPDMDAPHLVERTDGQSPELQAMTVLAERALQMLNRYASGDTMTWRDDLNLETMNEKLARALEGQRELAL